MVKEQGLTSHDGDARHLTPPIDPELSPRIDSSLRLILRLIQNGDLLQLRLRTGISEKPGQETYPLPVMLELAVKDDNTADIAGSLVKKFNIPEVYLFEIKKNKNTELRYATAIVGLVGEEIFHGRVDKFLSDLNDLLGDNRRASLGAAVQASLAGSLGDIGLPVDRKYNGYVLTGEKVIVGIVDDGCALAKWNFLKPTASGQAFASRIRYLWDQSAVAPRNGGWCQPMKFNYGLELSDCDIDAALNLPAHSRGDVIDEEKVHAYLEYPLLDQASHGTRVMDIAAGNGTSLMSSQGVAPGADIIFVQLPGRDIEEGRSALWKDILDGVAYVFYKAQQLGLPAVVNVSYGGYDGPHDGSNPLEAGIDQLLSLTSQYRSVVVAAGNGFEADCHASGIVMANGSIRALRWILPPEDPTTNDLEIWYAGSAMLEIRLTLPGAPTPTAWLKLGEETDVARPGDGSIVGHIDHRFGTTNNGDIVIHVALGPTDRYEEVFTGVGAAPFNAPAPAGEWLIEIRNPGNTDTQFHAWIWRDDSGNTSNARRQQSHFAIEDVDPRYTIAGIATGSRTVSVGAHNVPTQEICRYSACGPTRRIGDAGPERRKPDIYAPAEEDVAGRGVLAASSRRSRPTRINGTSASAPHVAGAVALMLQYARAVAQKPLSADQILEAVKQGADPNQLGTNLHQREDANVRVKQGAVMQDLVGSGKLDWLATMRILFP